MMSEAKEKELSETTKACSWRCLPLDRIRDLVKIADSIHPGLSERADVFVERVKLFPDGCLGLFDPETDELYGYAISHPINHRQPPALDSFLNDIDASADQYYIHDLAILPRARGSGSAQKCLELILTIAERYETTSLVSVYGTAPFWSKYGFEGCEIDDKLRAKLVDYGDDAMYLERRNKQHTNHN